MAKKQKELSITNMKFYYKLIKELYQTIDKEDNIDNLAQLDRILNEATRNLSTIANEVKNKILLIAKDKPETKYFYYEERMIEGVYESPKVIPMVKDETTLRALSADCGVAVEGESVDPDTYEVIREAKVEEVEVKETKEEKNEN